MRWRIVIYTALAVAAFAGLGLAGGPRYHDWP